MVQGEARLAACQAEAQASNAWLWLHASHKQGDPAQTPSTTNLCYSERGTQVPLLALAQHCASVSMPSLPHSNAGPTDPHPSCSMEVLYSASPQPQWMPLLLPPIALHPAPPIPPLSLLASLSPVPCPPRYPHTCSPAACLLPSASPF